MLSFPNAKNLDQLTKNPFAAFGKLFEIQRSAIGALGEIFENGGRAMMKLANVSDPEALMSAPQTILAAVVQQNLAVMTRVGQSWSADIAKIKDASDRAKAA